MRVFAILIVIVAFITTLFFASTSRATAGVNDTINFQGRLLSSSGAVVADGYYNIQFKIYQDGDGLTAGNPSGTLEWTETHINNQNSEGIFVRNGLFSVNLGSVTPFADSVDWNQDTLWLSINIAGSDDDCTTFGTSPCVADGEMLPMKRLTSSPYALNSGAVGGKTSDQLVQLGQGVQEDASDSSSIFINKTGTGNLLQLQNTGTDVFSISETGSLTLGSGDTQSISIDASGADTVGQELTIAAGSGGSGSGSAGGNLILQGGDAGGTDGNGGNLVLGGGAGTGTGSDGLVILSTAAFSTVEDDVNCFASGANVASSCTVAQTTINEASAVMVGFSAVEQIATIPDPTNTTAGRAFYVMASTDSEPFTIQANSGATLTTMTASGSATLIWNGTDWTATGSSAPTALHDAYDDVSDTIHIQVGDGTDNSDTTLLTLDKASSAPTVDSSLVGSMYYDTTLGEIQCYEADGWGSCSTAPDTFVTLSPEFSNAVVNGTGTGTLDSDICSDALDLNDGTSAQPTVCGTNETYNFYDWTSSEITAQENSIYVTYQLPSNFNGFVANSTSLMARTDSTDASVSYQIYQSNSSGLTACGSSISASTGAQTTWQEATASSGNDPASCSFAAGESIVFKITASSANDAHAYISNLNFTYSNS